MSIHTNKGDKGKTSINGKKEISKSNQIFEVLGTVDELNACLGLLHLTRLKEVTDIVVDIQGALFRLGSILISKPQDSDLEILNKGVKRMEDSMEKFEKRLPQLSNFIIPGGTLTSARFHIARAVCRRLERRLVIYFKSNVGNKAKDQVFIFINRLSDFLFVLARYSNFKVGVKEEVWRKGL